MPLWPSSKESNVADQFTCARCKRTFPKAWSDDEAKAEARELFGYDVPKDQVEELCDECYGEFTEWVSTLSPAERAGLDAQTLGKVGHG